MTVDHNDNDTLIISNVPGLFSLIIPTEISSSIETKSPKSSGIDVFFIK